MNAKLESFINQKKSKHLVELGLVDESKPIKKKKYTNVYQEGSHLDNKKNLYYTEVIEYEPIDITDEEYQELLKYAPVDNEKFSATIEHANNTTWGNAIKVIANILLVFNILAGLILFFYLNDSYSTDDYAWIPIVSTLTYCVLWYSLIVGFSKIVAFAEKNLDLE